MPLVQALIQDKPGGELLLVANSSSLPVKVSFALSSLGPGSRVRGFFDKRERALTDGRFSEELEPYAVRVYETLHSKRDPDSPVSLGMNVVLPRVKKTGEAGERRLEFFEPEDRAVSFKGYEKVENPMIWSHVDDIEQALLDVTPPQPGENLLKNSGFEEQTIPLLADRWMPSSGLFGRTGILQDAKDDPAVAYEGRYSLLLKPQMHHLVYYHWWGNWKRNIPYVFSAYVKASRENATATLALCPSAGPYVKISKSFTVGTQWQRIEWTFTIPEQGGGHWTRQWRGPLCPYFENVMYKEEPRADI